MKFLSSLQRRLRSQQPPFERIQLSLQQEYSHQFRIGDTGTGKTNLLRQDLLHAERTGRICVVHAPEAQLVQEFYSWRRGDWILNPGDVDCPYWDLPSEVVDLPSAQVVAGCLLPRSARSEGSKTTSFIPGARICWERS